MASKQELTAVIDVGSNRLTMKIAELGRSSIPRVIEQVRGSLALGEDTYTTQRIREENIRRCCEILLEFKQKLKEYKITQVKIVATSAIREARNRDYVCTRIMQQTGFDVEVLDNNMERFYHQIAMTERISNFSDLIKEGVTVIDIGAGSVQISSYDEGGLAYSHNLLLGALRVHEMMDRLKDKTKNYTELLNEYISSELNDFYILEGATSKPTHIIALGPQLSYLKQLAGVKSSEETMSLKTFSSVLELLRTQKAIELTINHGIPAHEAELLLPAATILDKYTGDSKGKLIYMPESDLSDSLLMDLAMSKGKELERYDHHKDILTAARHIAERFRYDYKHTEVVTEHALQLFDVLKKAFGLTSRQRLYLELAGILHDTGKFIQINRHSRQSFHIINSLDLFGVSDRERLLIAYIARFHSASWLPTQDDMPELSSFERQTVLQLAALLRLSDGLDASHRQKMDKLFVRLKDHRLIIEIDNSIDTTLETSSAAEKSYLLLEVYGVVLEFKYQAHEYFVTGG